MNKKKTESKTAKSGSTKKKSPSVKELNETINIEIIPYQNKDNYFKIKNILLDDYSVVPQKISRYDKMFIDYTIYNFCWHTKIKLFSDREPLVKFYRTYPHNPFLGYHNYK